MLLYKSSKKCPPTCITQLRPGNKRSKWPLLSPLSQAKLSWLTIIREVECDSHKGQTTAILFRSWDQSERMYQSKFISTAQAKTQKVLLFFCSQTGRWWFSSLKLLKRKNKQKNNRKKLTELWISTKQSGKEYLLFLYLLTVLSYWVHS